MGPKTERLVVVLDKLIVMLNDDEQQHWATWMSQARSWIVESDLGGIEKVLMAYGGMGSFNDTGMKTVSRANEEFEQLRTEAWQLATEIKNENEIST